LFRWLYKLADLARDRARRKIWDADHALGRRGEDVAHRYLQSKGYHVIARNYRTPSGSGELDLVASKGNALVIVEVKSRTYTNFGLPERNVDHEKELHIIRGAEDFARRAEIPLNRVRFDIIAIVFGNKKVPEIRHLEDVFHPGQTTPPSVGVT
jgi:putative endonuclease